MADRSVDILIVGAGPAGSAAAIEARSRGLEAVVVDKAVFPRAKCCGDGLTTSALRHLEDLGLDPTEVPSWKRVDRVVLVTPKGREIAYSFPDGPGSYAVAARRSELDHALVRRARAVGAEVLERHELVAVEAGSDHDKAMATVTDGDGGRVDIEADLVVAADGMWSPTRKLLGLNEAAYRGEWHAFRQYFSGVAPRAAEELIVWFDPDILPGYIWSFPLADGSANVGFGIQRGRRFRIQDMKDLWTEILASDDLRSVLGPDAVAEGPHRAWPIPARLGRLSLAQGRVVFVGDAAAATDPMSGEGIGQAIETGRLAVECHHQTQAHQIDGQIQARPGRTAERYRQALSRGMERDHLMARALSAVLAYPVGAEMALAATGLTGWTRSNFVRWLFEDYPRATMVNPRRWGRTPLAAPAPYRNASLS